MNSWLDAIPKLDVANQVEKLMDVVTDTFAGFFKFIQNTGEDLMIGTTDLLVAIPPILFIILVAIISFFATGKKFGLALFSLLGLLFINNQGLWEQLMNTFTLVIYSSLLAIIIGIPIGILMSKSTAVEQIVKPILDFMQTILWLRLFNSGCCLFWYWCSSGCIRIDYLCVATNCAFYKFRDSPSAERFNRSSRFLREYCCAEAFQSRNATCQINNYGGY